MSIIVVAIASILFGILVGYAGLRLLVEYRGAFLANPRAMMTLDLLIQVVTCGSVPVYLALLCFIGAVAFVFGGIGILVAETLHALRWL